MIEEVISNDYDISETFHKCFANTVPNLKIKSSENFKTAIEYEIENPVQNAINNFKNHLSIMIMSEINPNKRFSFSSWKFFFLFKFLP